MKLLNRKIIEFPPQAVRPWWVGRTVTCQCCGSTVEMEEGDDARAGVSLRTWNNTLSVRCVTCAAVLRIDGPAAAAVDATPREEAGPYHGYAMT